VILSAIISTAPISLSPSCAGLEKEDFAAVYAFAAERAEVRYGRA
jgi:hypothetical protein